MTHYVIIQGVQRDGHPYHPSGELSYLAEFSAAQVAELVRFGTVLAREGDIPDAPPPPPAPAPAPAPEPQPQPLYLAEWNGEGDPPPGTWAYWRAYGWSGLDTEPETYLVGDTVYTSVLTRGEES